ncbi:MFS transporter [Sphingomonas crocodyli]|nr:MFS transporter [Sphingomonas crocodyli]
MASATDEQTYPSPVAAWSAVAILFTLSIVSMLDRNLLSLLVPEIKADLGISEVEAGTLMGMAYALFYALGALPLGWAMDRYSRPKVIWFGVTLWSIGTVACGFARSFWTFFAARATVGGGEATIVPGTYSLLPDMFPRHKLGFAMSIFAMSSKVGAGASLALGGLLTALIVPAAAFGVPLLGEMKGWQLIFIVAGVPGLLLALMVFLVKDPRRGRAATGQPAANFADYGRFVWANRRFILSHHIAIMPLVALIFGFYAWLPSFYQRVHGLTPAELGGWLGLAISTGPVLALPIHGLVTDRWFRSGRSDAHLRYLIGSLLLSLPFAIGAFVVASPYVSFVMIGIFFFAASGYLSLPTVTLQLVLPHDLRGKSAAVVLMMNGIVGAGGGPMVVAALSEKLGGPDQVGLSLMICAVVALSLTAFLYLFALKPLRAMLAPRAA